MRIVFQYLKPYVGKMTLGLFIKFVGTIMDLFLPWILAYMIDSIVPTKQVTLIVFWGIMMVVCSIIAVVGNIVANRMASAVARDTTKSLRYDLFSKISSLSCKQTDTYTIPSLISRLSSDTYNIHQMVGSMQRMGIRAPILLIGGIFVTLTLEPVLTLVLVSVLPFITIAVWLISRKGVPLYGQVQKTVDKMVRNVRESFTGIRVIKALSKTDAEKTRFAGINEELVGKEKKASITMGITNPMMNLFLNIGLTLVIAVGAYRVNGGLTQPGKIIAFMTYFTIILNAMLTITRIFVMYSKGSASAQRICEIMETKDGFLLEKTNPIQDQSAISFENVNFSYQKIRNDVTNINFKLKKGETLGIIGSTGSGKSTIVQLLLRFYDTDSGTIRINGQSIKSIPFDEFYHKFGVVFQNDFLYADTVAENITFGRTISREAMEKAANYAQAEEFLSELPDGYDHPLTTKGSNFSGGQKQRLLLARALADAPEILILDDSSSALDYKTDSQLRQAIRQNFQQTTTILVAQRISSIMQANHILVLEQGKEIGYGTHEELLQTCPIYQEISHSQMGDRRK